MPINLKCTVKLTAYVQPNYYKLIWMKADGTFVSGNNYCVKSGDFDSVTSTQDHYLTVYKADTGSYTCMVISSRKIIDSKTQHVFVTESEHCFRLFGF